MHIYNVMVKRTGIGVTLLGCEFGLCHLICPWNEKLRVSVFHP